MGEELGALALAAARAMVGARFRPQGRDAATGLDCVGLVWAAYAGAGRVLPAPRAYPLRGWPRGRVEGGLRDAGFARADGGARPGDVALIDAGGEQFHLALIGADSFVHAHAGLRRVVETPLAGTEAMSLWRLAACPPRCG